MFTASEILQDALVNGKSLELHSGKIITATDLVVKHFDQDLVDALIASTVSGAPDDVIGADAFRLITAAFQKAISFHTDDLYDLNAHRVTPLEETSGDPIPF